MYVEELFSGLSNKTFPKCTTFSSDGKNLVIQKDIPFNSVCEHHLQPFSGKVQVHYISNGTVLGLSKINRIVEYFARRPQIQERLTKQILIAFQEVLQTKNVLVQIDSTHSCIENRGIRQKGSSTMTIEYDGEFKSLKEHPRL